MTIDQNQTQSLSVHRRAPASRRSGSPNEREPSSGAAFAARLDQQKSAQRSVGWPRIFPGL